MKKFQMLFEQNIASNVTKNQEPQHVKQKTQKIHLYIPKPTHPLHISAHTNLHNHAHTHACWPTSPTFWHTSAHTHILACTAHPLSSTYTQAHPHTPSKTKEDFKKRRI